MQGLHHSSTIKWPTVRNILTQLNTFCLLWQIDQENRIIQGFSASSRYVNFHFIYDFSVNLKGRPNYGIGRGITFLILTNNVELEIRKIMLESNNILHIISLVYQLQELSPSMAAQNAVPLVNLIWVWFRSKIFCFYLMKI